jgi:hypothetical protein
VTQLPLAVAGNFAGLARARDVPLDAWRLEAVRRPGLKVPLFAGIALASGETQERCLHSKRPGSPAPDDRQPASDQ